MFLSLILTILFFLGIFFYVFSHLDDFRSILSRRVPTLHILLLICSIFLTYLVNARILRRALLVHQVKVPLMENLSLTYATTAANYFMPFKGAVGLRALYLRRRFELPLKDFISQLMMVSVITLGISSIFALLGLIFLPKDVGGKSAILVGIYFTAVIVLGLASLILGKLGVKLPKRLMGFLESWDRYRANTLIFSELLVLDTIYYLLWCLTNYLALSAFQVKLNLFESFFYTSLQIHALIINLTPAGLGIVEAMSVFAGSILDFSPAEALLAQGLSRLCAIFILSLCGVIGWLHLVSIGGKKKSDT
jgi:uncharacterized membrane protein YbhN (UPF0104 family)